MKTEPHSSDWFLSLTAFYIIDSLIEHLSNDFLLTTFLTQIGEVKVPLCMVDLAQTIEEWKDIQSLKVDDQVRPGLATQLTISHESLFSILETCASHFVTCQHREN